MKYVLDSSVAFKWVVPEVNSDKADRLRDDFRNAVHELLAPDIFPPELAHALTRAERQKRIKVGQAGTYLANALTTPPHPTFILPSRSCSGPATFPLPSGSASTTASTSPWPSRKAVSSSPRTTGW